MMISRRTALAGSLAATGLLAGSSLPAEAAGPSSVRRGNPRIRLGVCTYSYWHFKGPKVTVDTVIEKAGALGIEYLRAMPKNLAEVTIGSFGTRRLLGAGSTRVGDGTWLAAFEANTYNGPWDVPDDVRKLNGVLHPRGEADRRRHLPDVVVEEQRRLPERQVALLLDREALGDRERLFLDHALGGGARSLDVPLGERGGPPR